MIDLPVRALKKDEEHLKIVLSNLPDEFLDFRELITNGFMLSFYIKQIYPSAIIRVNLIDRNAYYFWKYVQNKPKILAKKIEDIKKVTVDGAELYEYAKDPNCDNKLESAIKFFILRQTTTNANFHKGKYSEENFNKNIKGYDTEQIIKSSEVIEDFKFYLLEQEDLMLMRGKQTLLHIDATNSKGEALIQTLSDTKHKFVVFHKNGLEVPNVKTSILVFEKGKSSYYISKNH